MTTRWRGPRRAADIFARHGDLARLARLDGNLGNLLHRQDRFDEAMERYRRAYGLFMEVGEPRDVATALQNMATCQISMNDFRQAMDTYERARRYCVEHELPLLVAVADYNIAYLYYLRGEYTKAIEMYRAAREHCRALGDAYREALCDLDESEMYVELNLNEEGAHLARRAMSGFQKLGNGYEAAKALTNLAISLSHHGDSQPALNVFRKARELFTREGNQAWIAIIDLYQALVFYQERRLTESRLLCEQAYEFFSPTSLAGKGDPLPVAARADSPRLGTARAREAYLLRRSRQAGTGRNAGAQLPGLFCAGLDRGGAWESGRGPPGLPDGASHLESLRSHLRDGRDENRFPEGQARGLRGAGADVHRGPRHRGKPAGGVRLHRAGQIAQPGGPDRVSRAGSAALPRHASRTGRSGAHPARGVELVYPRAPTAGEPLRRFARPAHRETAAQRAGMRASPGARRWRTCGWRTGSSPTCRAAGSIDLDSIRSTLPDGRDAPAVLPGAGHASTRVC